MSEEFAIYKGDKLLCFGTVKECAEKLGITESTVRFYQYDSYQKRAKCVKNRRVAIKI